DKPVTVAEGVTFNVPASSAVSVGSGAEFTVTGTVAVASGGNFTVESNGTANVSGQLTVGSGNTPSNNVNSYNANYQAAVSGNGILAQEGETDEGTLTVSSGGTLKVTGKVTVNGGGSLDVAGTINIEGNVEVAGTIVLQNESSGSLTGTLTITSTGTSKDLKSGGGSITGDGGSVVHAGAKVYIGGSTDATALVIGPAADGNAILQLAQDTTFSTVSAGYELDGNATLKKNFGISEGQILTVKSGGKLTVNVPNGDTYPGLWVIGSNTKIVGEADAVIDIKSETGGLIYLSSGAVSNFYDSSSELITSGSNINIPKGTYNWSATAGGQNKPGWKAEASG
ncbi:MAG: hypothetical protein LBJ86_03795, partial [Spirochaetaceae bacterium]|nr:hypothetical protein [Spirochaetaceae bacterium]